MESMRLSTRLLHFMEDVFTLGVTLASDAIDSWSSGESRQALLQRLRDAVQRSSELVLEKARLEEEVDSLRFNGPSLYNDEVEALYHVLRVYPNATGMHHDGAKEHMAAIEQLLNRCDHLPMTAQELNDQLDDVLTGKGKTYTWDEVFGNKGHDIDGNDCGYPEKPCQTCKNWDFSEFYPPEEKK